MAFDEVTLDQMIEESQDLQSDAMQRLGLSAAESHALVLAAASDLNHRQIAAARLCSGHKRRTRILATSRGADGDSSRELRA